MRKTAQSEEEQWLAKRWLDLTPNPVEGRRRGRNHARKDGAGCGEAVVAGNGDSICKPTLDKLYAAQRKRDEDLKKQMARILGSEEQT